MKRIIIFICNFFALTLCVSPRISKVYRSDYEYNRKTDAFYKLNIVEVNFVEAKKRCEVEGAKLMLPATDFDIAQLHGMFKKYPDLGNHVWVNHEGATASAEENPIIPIDNSEDNTNPLISDYYDSASVSPLLRNDCEAMTREGDIKSTWCYLQRPFICKVEAKDAPYDAVCDVYGTNYEYVASVGSCYKISTVAYTWNEAYAECQAQTAHLVVLNSEAESVAVKNIMQKTPHNILRTYSPYYYIAGFRAKKPSRTFMTIFNQTLEEAGFSEWAFTEPNNFGGQEYCGSLFESDGKLNDHNCINAYGFICEKEKHI